MQTTRRTIAAFAFVLWIALLLFIGSKNTVLLTTASIFLGFFICFDVSLLGVFFRMGINQRPESIHWSTVSAIMPRDGHTIDEQADVIGVILDVRDLRLKRAEISK
jgi:hypothetical protein